MNIQRQKDIQEQYRINEIGRQKREIEEFHPELLIPGDLVFINVMINGISIPAMIDTGAQNSIISLKYCMRLNLENQIDYNYKSSFQGVGTMSSIGTIHLVYMTIGNIQCPVTLNVFDNKSPLDHLLIGIGTLRSLRLKLNFQENVVEIGDEKVPMLSNTDVNYATHKPFNCPPISLPLKINRNRTIKTGIQRPFVKGEYERYSDIDIEQLIICGLTKEQAMNMLDSHSGDVNKALLLLSGDKTSLFNSF